MRFGNCISYKDLHCIEILKKTGFDYVEIPVAPVYNADMSEVSAFLNSLEKNNIRCEAVNVLFMGGIILTGDKADISVTTEYLKKLFDKTKDFGYEIVVFGSGGARRYPEGFPKDKAIKQIIDLTKNILSEYAEKYNFTIAIEELNRNETNIINTLSEVKYIVDEVNSPRIKLLADLYHIGLENDDISQLADYGDIIAHCHIGNPQSRHYPHKNAADEMLSKFKEFFGALKLAGYDKRMSIEASLGAISNDFEEESRLSLEFMKTLCN